MRHATRIHKHAVHKFWKVTEPDRNMGDDRNENHNEQDVKLYTYS